MKCRVVIGIILMAVSGGAVAELMPEFVWPVATVSEMLTAMGAHKAQMLNQVIAPGATYYANYDAEAKKHSASLGLDSFAKMARHCSVTSINTCSPTAVSVDWVCADRPADSNEVFSKVSLDAAGRITSVTGDTAPLVCTVTAPAAPPSL